MPRVVIVNETNVPLHIALKQISPLYFINNVPPQGGQAVFEHVGRVWFTVEARVARQAASSVDAEQTTEQDERTLQDVKQIEAGPATLQQTSERAVAGDDSTLSKKSVAGLKARAKGLGSSVQSKFSELRSGADPNNTSNEYTTFQTYAAPVAVSVAALSLGAGAIYIGMSAGAAGGVSAALTSTSAKVSSAAVSGGATAQRFASFAKKGQKVAQIGHVLGIGGGAITGSLLGMRDAERESGLSDTERKQVTKAARQPEIVPRTDGAGTGGGGKDLFDRLTDTENIDRIKSVTRVLQRLVTKPVVSSHGWYMGEERTIVIRGGPKAAEVDEWLIIETDTVEPFEVVAQRLEGDKDSAEAVQEEQKAIEAAAQDKDKGDSSDDNNTDPEDASLSRDSTPGIGVTQTTDAQGMLVEKHDPLAKLRKKEAKAQARQARKAK